MKARDIGLLVFASCIAVACTQDFDLFFQGAGTGAAGGTGGAGGDGGSGGCTTPEDCLGGDTTCRYRTCDGGVCGTEDAAAGTDCTESGGQFCDGNGNCVECLTESDCPTGEQCNQNGECVGGGCADDEKNGDETDVDCGGGTCPPCPNHDARLAIRDG